jgi:hypothetical protein
MSPGSAKICRCPLDPRDFREISVPLPPEEGGKSEYACKFISLRNYPFEFGATFEKVESRCKFPTEHPAISAPSRYLIIYNLDNANNPRPVPVSALIAFTVPPFAPRVGETKRNYARRETIALRGLCANLTPARTRFERRK